MVLVAITYSALISACEKGKQPELALQVFEATQQQGVEPHVFTYSILISACEKGNAATKRGARRLHLQRLDQCMRKGASIQSEPYRFSRQCSSKAWY